jgi:hypothetical protein
MAGADGAHHRKANRRLSAQDVAEGVIANTVRHSSVKFGKTELNGAAVQPLYGALYKQLYNSATWAKAKRDSEPRRSCAPTIAPPLRLQTNFMTYPPSFLRVVRGVADDVGHNIRVREHRDVTAFDLPYLP